MQELADPLELSTTGLSGSRGLCGRLIEFQPLQNLYVGLVKESIK